MSDDVVSALTAKFIADKTPVWKQAYIEAALLAMPYRKCAYCETLILDEAKYLEIEHFRNKDDFPTLVVDWANLLPSCKRCNLKKGTHNVEVDGMIIDPTVTV